MTDYRLARVAGAIWFFTLGLAERLGATLPVDKVDALGAAFRTVQARHPFHMEAVVVLPDHLHCVWSLPDGDADYSTRWSLDQGHVLTGHRAWRAAFGAPAQAWGARHLATAVLGTLHS